MLGYNFRKTEPAFVSAGEAAWTLRSPWTALSFRGVSAHGTPDCNHGRPLQRALASGASPGMSVQMKSCRLSGLLFISSTI